MLKLFEVLRRPLPPRDRGRDRTDEPRADHAKYLASWFANLKTGKKANITAAWKATEASAFRAACQDE
jgi:hypothetical protein